MNNINRKVRQTAFDVGMFRQCFLGVTRFTQVTGIRVNISAQGTR
jgi:hypothetical protein